MKYGIIGCGKHALHSHALPGKDIIGLALGAVFDVSQQSMGRFEEEYGEQIDKYTEIRPFLESDVDAVLIGSPDEFHFSSLVEAVGAGKHVFVEKPLATTIADVDGLKPILEKANDRGLVVSSCHPRRLDPPFLWLYNRIAEFEGKMGKPISFHFDFSYHKPSKEWKHDRGLLLDHLNHEIDFLHFLFGHEEFEAHRLNDQHDAYHVVGVRSDGLSFNFEGTRKLEAKTYPEFTRIRFERGEVYLDSHKGSAIIHNHDHDASVVIGVPRTDYELRGRRTLENFVKAIRREEPCYLTRDDLYVNTAASVILTHNKNWTHNSK
jgi:predicted dehydrogenase